MRTTLLVAALLALPATARAQRWIDSTSTTIGTTAEWTNKVELADVDGDGWQDILFANGRGYATPGTAEASRVFRNRNLWDGAGPYFEEITTQVFGTDTGHARVIKVRDVDGDGDDDVFVGNTFGDPSRLYRRDPAGWTDVTEQTLPGAPVPWVGDADFGDVDGDGDLDLVLADWGTDLDAGARPRLWLNDGAGGFTDATATHMPDVAAAWSWELDLTDIDGDFDLDLMVACKSGPRSLVFVNDGGGRFADESAARLPAATNNYEIELMDLDGDGDLELATINDGAGGRNRLFRNDGGVYVEITSTHLMGTANPPTDDNVIAFVDADSDGDADMIVGSLGASDRLLLNDGSGHLTLDDGAFPGSTRGTLGMAVGHLDNDAHWDVVDGQGEAAFPDFVYRGLLDLPPPATGFPPDQQQPHIGAPALSGRQVRVRVHDGKSPATRRDLQNVLLRYRGAAEGQLEMTWYGEFLWRAELPTAGTFMIEVCATDAGGFTGCTDEETVEVIEGGEDAGVGTDAGSPAGGGGGGCCGAAPGAGRGSVLLAAALFSLLFGVPRRRRAMGLRSWRCRARVRLLTRT